MITSLEILVLMLVITFHFASGKALLNLRSISNNVFHRLTYSKINTGKFIHKLEWSLTYSIGDPNIAYHLFVKIMNHINDD